MRSALADSGRSDAAPLDDIWRLVEWRAARTPDDQFLSDDYGRSLTFGEFALAAEQVAAGLAEFGVGPGTRVMWQLPTALEAVVLSAALARLGAVQNPVIAMFREAELRSLNEQFRPEVVVTVSSWRGFAHRDAIAAIVGPDVPVLVSDHWSAGTGLALPLGDPTRLPEPAPSEGVRWIYTTSGSTGGPKGVQHSDATLINSCNAISEQFPWLPTDVYAVSIPYSHIGGGGLLANSMRTAHRMVLFDVFDPVETPKRMAAHGATILGSATPFFVAFLAAQRAHGPQPLFDKLRICCGGGAPIPLDLDEQIRSELGGIGVSDGYGLTEFPMAGYPDPDDEQARRMSMWVPAPGVRVRIVDMDGRECATGESGELRLDGPQKFLGYLDSSRNAEAFDEQGYVRTGDLAAVDEGGRIMITGRLKEIVVRNGENISMAEVEAVIAGHPGIEDVAVIGLPDAKRGEICCAVIAPAADGPDVTLDGLAEVCVAAGLAKYKIPEQIEIVSAIPRNAMGKVQRNLVRAQLRRQAE